MLRFGPKSLAGQLMLATALTLLIAQAISAVLLYRAAEQRRDIGIMHAAALRRDTSDQQWISCSISCFGPVSVARLTSLR